MLKGWTSRLIQRSLPPWCPLLPVAAFILINVLLYMSWPITAGDTDLWYHLAAGRYIAQHHTIPHESFFSFLQPPRPYIDYYWFFQLLVYQLHAWWGYPGLIALRTFLYITTILIVARYLFAGASSFRAQLYSAAVFMMVAVVLQYRFMIVRPHMVTYLCVAAFLLIVEYYPQWALVLPLVGVVWMNTHGIVYPIMGLICVAYLLEYLLCYAMGTLPRTWNARSFLVPLLVCLATVCCTPFGVRLLNEALVSTHHAAEYIAELTPYSVIELASFRFSSLLPTRETLVNLVFFVACGSAIAAGVRRHLRLSHLVLLVGGTALMFKHWRFLNEFVLLTVPLLKAHPFVAVQRKKPPPSLLLASTLLVLLLAVPLLMARELFGDRARYPLSPQGLPTGVVTFLQRVNVGGTILNHPNHGGYFEWLLFPRYRICADLQVPFLFSDEDIFTALYAFKNGEVLRKVIAAYHPAFITVQAGEKEFPKLIEPMPQYRMVFFDDEEVLYVDRAQYPDVAAQYGLSALNPFQVDEHDMVGYLDTAIHEGKRDAMRQELDRMLEIAPEVRLTNELAATLYKIDGALTQSIPYAQRMIDAYPELAEGYASKADALGELGRSAEALPLYGAALARANPTTQRRIYRALGRTYRALGQHEAAYQAFRRGIKAFSVGELAYDDLCWLGSTALLTGRTQEGLLYLRLATRLAPPEDPQWRQWQTKLQPLLPAAERMRDTTDPVLQQE